MAEATSIVGRFDGVVTYGDESWGSFHSQIESFDLTNDSIWSLAENFSESNIQKLYGDAEQRANIKEMFESLPFVSSFMWADESDTSKTVTDVVFHLYLLVTFDDGSTYPVSITFEKDEVRLHSSETSEDVPLAKLELMLEKIMRTLTIS